MPDYSHPNYGASNLVFGGEKPGLGVTNRALQPYLMRPKRIGTHLVA